MKLRPYQEKAINDLMAWLGRHQTGYPIIDACVGAGKSVIIAEICKRFIAEHPSTRIIMAVASRELVMQNAERLRAVWPEAPIGICSGDIGKDVTSQVIFGTINTLANHSHNLGQVDVLLIDECHNVNPAPTGMYREFEADLRRYGSVAMCVIGFTGTPFRGNGVFLHDKTGAIFGGIAARVTMDELLEIGYLAPLVVDGETPTITGDLTAVKIDKKTNDYAVDDLSNAMCNAELVRQTVSDLISRGANRKKWLVYCVSVEHAKMFRDELLSRGINCALVTGKTPPKERKAHLASYKTPNGLSCLVSVGVLTTGFDAPETDLLALVRPTKSSVLYVQIAGRGMRIADGKTDCLWLDYTETTAEKGAVNKIKGHPAPKISSKKGEAPRKFCPVCDNPSSIGAKECVDCGFLFPEDRLAHETKAGKASILADVKVPENTWHDVYKVMYNEHYSSPEKPPTLRVDYHIGDPSNLFSQNIVSTWLAFEALGLGLIVATNYWRKAWDADFGQLTIPQTIAEALEHANLTGSIRPPKRISSRPNPDNPQYLQVTNYEF